MKKIKCKLNIKTQKNKWKINKMRNKINNIKRINLQIMNNKLNNQNKKKCKI